MAQQQKKDYRQRWRQYGPWSISGDNRFVRVDDPLACAKAVRAGTLPGWLEELTARVLFKCSLDTCGMDRSEADFPTFYAGLKDAA